MESRFALLVVLTGVTSARAQTTPAALEMGTLAPAAGEQAVVAAEAAPEAAEKAARSQTLVRGERKAGMVEVSVGAAEAGRLAGSAGDPLKVIEVLPGVGRAPLGSGQLVIWGAAPSASRVLVDGVEVPALYHLGGWRSVVGAELVRSVDLAPGAFGPEWGRATGGLVRVHLADARPPNDGVHATLSADLLDAAATVSAALGSRLQIVAAGRFGYLDRLADAVLSPAQRSLFAIPRYADAQLRLRLRLRAGETLRATILFADDQLVRAAPAPNPQSPQDARSDATARRFYRALLEYRRALDGGESLTLTASLGLDENRSTTAFGLRPTSLGEDTLSYGLRAAWKKAFHPRVTASVGLDLRGEISAQSRAGSLTLPPREGDLYVFGQSPGSDDNADRWTTHIADVGPYLLADLSLGPVTLSPGLRLDAFLIDASRLTPPVGATLPIGTTRIEWALDPRLAIKVRANSRLTLVAAGGIYHQPPAASDLSAVFGNPLLAASRAFHAIAGATVRITPTLSVEATGYYRYADGQASRASAPTPPLAGVLGHDGTSTSFGGQLLIRQELWRDLSGWISYTAGRSERRDHPDAAPRLSDFDQTHVLAAVASYRFRGFGFGARLRYATGLPRTPVTGGYYDAQADQFQPLFGARNSIRLPDFVQLDLRVDRTFTVGGATIDLYLDAQNVTNQKNAEEVVYSANYRQRRYITGLPTLAVLGARLAF